MPGTDLHARLVAALETPDPVPALEALVAQEQARALRLSAEPLRNIGRRCHGTPGDRHRRHVANQCAELLIRRSRELARTADYIRRINLEETNHG